MKLTEVQRGELFHALREPELLEAASVDAIGSLDEIVAREVDLVEPIIANWLEAANTKNLTLCAALRDVLGILERLQKDSSWTAADIMRLAEIRELVAQKRGNE